MTVPASIRNPDPPIKDSVFDMFRLDGRTIIITGGTGGIGYEVGRGLAEAGANVSTAGQRKKTFKHFVQRLTNF
jgi:NADP-dependent 3-hydroxy acid dehydrogenase YdfG